MSEIQSSKLRSRSVSRSEFVPGAGLEPACRQAGLSVGRQARTISKLHMDFLY